MPVASLELSGVSKVFRSGWLRTATTTALEGVDLHLERGARIAVMGPNGAGKSTLLRLAAGLLVPDSGAVRVDGETPLRSATRKRIGFAEGSGRSLFARLTGRQNLALAATLYGLSDEGVRRRIAALTKAFDLTPVLDKRVDRCSAGMRVRLALARALLATPSLLLLDEPTNSLDPAHRAAAVEALTGVGDTSATILMATHSEDEAKALGATILWLERGRLREGGH